jgi:hypothetical protein
LEQLAWTSVSGNEAFLALDRNGNGQIDDGTELFGDSTEQPKDTGTPNGYLALSVYDSLDRGGNGDGIISTADSVYSELLLWLDRNRDGVSQPSELFSLEDEEIASIDLYYWESRARDEHGNWLRYWGAYHRLEGQQGFSVDVIFSVLR